MRFPFMFKTFTQTFIPLISQRKKNSWQHNLHTAQSKVIALVQALNWKLIVFGDYILLFSIRISSIHKVSMLYRYLLYNIYVKCTACVQITLKKERFLGIRTILFGEVAIFITEHSTTVIRVVGSNPGRNMWTNALYIWLLFIIKLLHLNALIYAWASLWLSIDSLKLIKYFRLKETSW